MTIRVLEGLEAAARVAGVLGGAAIELPKDYSVLLDLLSKKEGRLSQALHVAVDDLADLAPLAALAAQDIPLIASGSAQEASDMAVIASLVAKEIGAPVVHFFDRRWVGGEFSKIDVLEDEGLRRIASYAAGDGAAVPEIFERLCARLKDITGRSYRAYEYFGPAEPERVAVAFGAEAIPDAKTGFVRVRLWRPFDARRFLEALPSSVKTLLVAKSLHADVLSAIHQGIVGGWSWFTGLPPIQPLAPVAEDRELSKDIFEALISTDGKETEAAVRDLIEDLAGHSPSHFQSYTRTEGGMTAVYLRVSRDPIRRRGPVVRPALTLFLKGALLTASAEGAPIRSINLSDVARRSKLGDRVGPVVTSCLLSLMDSEKWTGLSEKRAREIVSEAIQDRWGDFSQDIVEAHRRAMDLTRTELVSPHPAVTLLTPPNNDVSKEQNSPSRCADLHSDYMGFRLRSPLIACVSGASGDDLRASLASAPIGAVFFGPVSEEELDREAWKTFSALNRGDRSEGFKARPPLDRQLELVRVWKSSVEAPVIAGISAVTEKNWLAIAFALEQAGADALELFLRSPEEGGPADPLRIVSLVSAAVRVPVGLRITPGLARLGENAEALAQAGAKGLVLFHAPLGFITHPDDLESREEELLTGPAVFRLALPALAALARNHPAPPLDLSAAGPVSASGDLFSALLSGAGAVYVTPEPENLRRLEEMLKAWMEAKGFASLREIRAFFLRDRERLSGVESEAHRGGS